jgi:UDP-glucuronate 4-epimerase
MSILVTGASGFVGLNLVELLLERGATVVAFADRPLPDLACHRFAVLPGRLHQVQGDVRDERALAGVMSDMAVERVAHGAAITSNTERERTAPQTILDVNLSGLASVVRASGQHGVRRLLFMGSLASFGNEMPDGVMLDEDYPHAPKTIYALTKSAAETVIARLGELWGVDWVVGRLGTVFGPWEHDTGVRDTLSAIHQVTAAALQGRPVTLPRPGRKNWHYVRDAAQGLCTLLLADEHRSDVYNLGSPFTWSVEEWCAGLACRWPGFCYAVGGGPGEPVELYGERDGGLLSWDRFTAEFGPSGRFDLPAAQADYLRFLDETDGFGLRP